MKKLREIHLYLGCLFAPVLIFFAMSGAWQLFALHRGRKDGSYSPPRAVVLLSDIHQVQHLPPTSSDADTPLRYFMLAAAIGLILTTILGIIMAFIRPQQIFRDLVSDRWGGYSYSHSVHLPLIL